MRTRQAGKLHTARQQGIDEGREQLPARPLPSPSPGKRPQLVHAFLQAPPRGKVHLRQMEQHEARLSILQLTSRLATHSRSHMALAAHCRDSSSSSLIQARAIARTSNACTSGCSFHSLKAGSSR